METQHSMTEVTKPQKYLFDLAFDDEDGRKEQEITYTQEQLDDARKESYGSGFLAGQKAVKEEQQETTNILLSLLREKLEDLTNESASVWRRQLDHLHALALVITRKIVPHFVAQNGTEEVEKIVERVITEMGQEPRLVVRVAESNFDELRDKINALAENHAFAGNIIVLGDPSFGISDCRVEWATGGVDRDMKALWQDIGRILEEENSEFLKTVESGALDEIQEKETTSAQILLEESMDLPSDVILKEEEVSKPTPSFSEEDIATTAPEPSDQEASDNSSSPTGDLS